MKRDGWNDIAMKWEQRENKMKSSRFPLAWVCELISGISCLTAGNAPPSPITAVDLVSFYHLSRRAGHRFSIVCPRCHPGIFRFRSVQSSQSAVLFY